MTESTGRSPRLAGMDIVWQALLVLQSLLLTAAESPGFPAFQFTVEPSDTVVTRGQPALLNCSAVHDDPPPAMAWLHDGVPINFDGDGRRYKLENGSLYLSEVEHSRSHRPDEGEYQCVATVPGLGTIVSRKAALQVGFLSRGFSAAPLALEVYLGDTAMLECQIDGAPTPSVRWYKDDQEITFDGANVLLHLDGTLEISKVTFADLGRYRCKVENIERARSSETVELSQKSDVSSYEGVAPAFVLTPRDKVALEGSILVLACGANGRDSAGKPPTLTWLRDGVTIDTSAEDTRFSRVGQGSLRVDLVKEEDAGSYTCRATNSIDSVDAEASITVHVPPRFVTWPQNAVAHVKGEVTLECEVAGVPKPNIVWLKNGDLFTPSDYFQIVDGRNLQILGLLDTDAGVYQCLAENDVGNIQAAAQLRVSPQLGPSEAAAGSSPNHLVPSAPTQLSAILVSQRFVTLSWRLPTHMGASDITGYSIYWKEEGSHRERLLNTTALEANIQHLKPDTQYQFRILAHNAEGASAEAARIAVTTQPEVNVPGPPTSLAALPLSPTSIVVTWAEPEVTNGLITNYKLYYYAAGESEQHDVNVEGHEYELMGLDKFVTYSFRVVAYNNIGPGTSTEEVEARTFSDVPDEAPQNVTVETGSSSSLVIRWQPPPEEDQNGLITGYKIRYKEKGGRGGETITTDANIRSQEIDDLKRGKEYQIRVQAMTVNGSGPAAPWFTAETYLNDLDENDVPDMPSSLHVRPMTTSIVVSWTPPREQGIMVRGYTLGYGIGVPDVYKQVLDAKQRSHTIKNLRPSSAYVISLRAFNNMGEGRPRYETGETREESRLEPLTPMHPPVGLQATVLSSTTIVLTWSDNTLGRNQRINDNRYYTVRYNPKMARKHKYINSTDLNVHIDDLRPNTEYEFSVKVLKGRRKSTWSLSVFNRTYEAAPATAPRDLTPAAVEGKPHWVTLNWQPPRQPNGQITGYLVFYTTDATQNDRDWAVEGIIGEKLSAVIKDLTPETTYYFKVQARNNKGLGPMSPTVIFRTPKADGTGGGRIKLPDDYGQPAKSGNPKYNINRLPPPADESTGGSGEQPLVMWISIGCVGGVTVIALLAITIVLCRRQSSRRGNRKGYKPANKKCGSGVGVGPGGKPGPKDLKPPDLWMDHDQMELKNLDGVTTLPPPGDKEEGMDVRRHSFLSERNYPPVDDRYHQTPFKPKPIMIPVDQPPPPREPIAMAVTNGHLTVGGPDPPPVTINPTPIRPIHPRTQYPGSTPRVNASDLPPPHMSSDELSLSTLERRRKPKTEPGGGGGDKRQRTPNNKITVKPQPQQQGAPMAQPPQQQQPPPHQQQQAVPPMKGGRSPMPVIVPKAPDVIHSASPSGQHDHNDMPKSFSTEELSAEMANLEGLMKDLNAITQQEFEC